MSYTYTDACAGCLDASVNPVLDRLALFQLSLNVRLLRRSLHPESITATLALAFGYEIGLGLISAINTLA